MQLTYNYFKILIGIKVLIAEKYGELNYHPSTKCHIRLYRILIKAHLIKEFRVYCI